MRKLIFFGTVMLLFGATTIPVRLSKPSKPKTVITSIDSLRHVTLKLEASTLKLKRSVNRLQ